MTVTKEAALAAAIGQAVRGCKNLPNEPIDREFEMLMYLSDRVDQLTAALSKVYGRWMLNCDPNNDYPDWPDDAAGVMNDLWKDGWPKMAKSALAQAGEAGTAETTEIGSVHEHAVPATSGDAS